MATKMDSAEKAFEAAALDRSAGASPASPPKKTAKTKSDAASKKAVKPGPVEKGPKSPAQKKNAPPAAAKTAASKGSMTMNDSVKNFTEEAKNRAEALTAEFNERAKEAMAKSTKLAEEALEFNKANVEALVEAGKVAAKNMEVLGQEGVTFARKSFEETTAALKSYTSVKSPTEFFQLYAENSKKAFDNAVAQASKTSELFVKMSNDSFAPISNRVSVITSKMKTA